MSLKGGLKTSFRPVYRWISGIPLVQDRALRAVHSSRFHRWLAQNPCPEFPDRDDADAKAWFYLDNRTDLETWAALRTDASALLDRYLVALAPTFEELAEELGAEPDVGRRVDGLVDVQPVEGAVGDEQLAGLTLDLGSGDPGADAIGVGTGIGQSALRRAHSCRLMKLLREPLRM